MSTVERAVTGVVFVLFLAAVALRPLGSNTGVSAAVENGLLAWPTVLWLPILGLSVLLVAARLGRVVGDSDGREVAGADPHAGAAGRRSEPSKNGEWRVVDGWDDETETGRDDVESGSGKTTRSDGHPTSPEHATELTAAVSRPSRPVAQRPVYSILTEASRSEVEQQPPDASLRDHLDHLRAELDDDETAGAELQELERIAAETEAESPIPDRCPQEHCDARWAERSILGINTGRYEVLEDGARVCCLECEAIVPIDDLR